MTSEEQEPWGDYEERPESNLVVRFEKMDGEMLMCLYDGADSDEPFICGKTIKLPGYNDDDE